MDLSVQLKTALSWNDRMEVAEFSFLTFPRDRATLSKLRLDELICWYACQDPRSLIYLAQTKEFKQFWYWHYLLPLRIKRFVYRMKHKLRFW